jgi:hypothetical protein
MFFMFSTYSGVFLPYTSVYYTHMPIVQQPDGKIWIYVDFVTICWPYVLWIIEIASFDSKNYHVYSELTVKYNNLNLLPIKNAWFYLER